MDHHNRAVSIDSLANVHLISIHSHSDKILSGLRDLRNDPTFTDAILCAGSNEYPCHRAVLASSSPYFKAMFSSHLRESHDNRVSFNDMSNAALGQIINFIYTGQAEINYENAQDLLAAASLLQYYEVVDACCDFLKCHLHSTNCLGIEWFSHLHSLQKLESEARQYAVDNFDSVIESDEFLQLSPERLCWYLDRSDIDVSSEEKLFEAAVRWADRVQYPEGALCQVFRLIRFNFMPRVYLSEVVSKGRHFRNCEHCLVAIQDIIEKSVFIEKFSDEVKQDSSTVSSPRPSTLAKEVIVILSSDDSENGVLETFDPVKDRWMVLTDERLPCTLVGVGITTVGNDIYVTGGIRREQVLAEVWCFLSKERRWKSLPSLLQPRAYHSCTSWNNCIYAFGGLGRYAAERRQANAIEVVECLDLTSLLNAKKSEIISLSWKVIANIPCPRIGSSAVTIEGRIIEVGGTQCGIPVKKLQSHLLTPVPHSWSTRINACSVIFAGGEQLVLPDIIEKSQMVVVDGQLYILWMDSGKFILLNPTKRIFKDLARPCISNVGGMAVVGTKIFVLGTCCNLDINCSKLIECYDTVKNIWVSTKYLGEWLNNVHCVTLKIKHTS